MLTDREVASYRKNAYGTPTIEPRLEAIDVRIPLPKPDRAASIFDLQEQAREAAFRG
ncbi:MAG TPA: hypothetical protein VGQ58_09130 [Candidatus Limnocylindrales bacterium]|jgi:hypothetical protein|nr:hypothetical protein [Candidatus Limnocylindrales bacterium]